jgi:Flp pilus assembly protein TadG
MSARSGLKRPQSGQAIVMFTMLVATVMVPMVGLAIDGGRAYLVRLKISSAVDGGALAAGRLLGTGTGASQQLANAQATAAQFVKANFPSNFFGASIAAGSPSVCVDPGTDSSDPCHVGNGGTVNTYKVRTVSVTASATMNTFFMGILGMPKVTVSATGLAQRRDVRVVLVIDRSSSMAGYFTGINQTPPSIQDMALQFVNSFSGSSDFGGRDQVGLVVFGGSGIVAYPARSIANDYTNYTTYKPPDNNFKTNSSGNIPGYIAEIQSGSNTGTAEALYLAYMALRADAATNTSLGSQLNVIVLLTDGLPNGITAFANDPSQSKNYMMASSSGCTDLGRGSSSASPLVSKSNTNMIGWFAQHNGFAIDNNGAFGLNDPMMAYAQSTSYTGKGDDINAWLKNAGEAVAPQMTPTSTCGSPMIGTMAKFPLHDAYGNYTDLTQVPAVNGLTMPTTPSGGPLYKLGSLYSNQCKSSTYNAAQTSNSCQIGLASWQATAHQAWKIWNQIVWNGATQSNIQDPGPNMSEPVIFTIGFNHPTTNIEPPDMTLLQLIANDPNSPVSFSNRINGQAFLASDANAVGAAFQQIASVILRLAR